MNPPLPPRAAPLFGHRWARQRWTVLPWLACALAVPASAHASMFHGETLDKIADVLAWVVLIVAPAVGLAVFWIVHILPEKIAEKKNHPQAKAIQCLCLLSLVFGGLLWPIAWLWAYTKPVLHKLAYGTDQGEHGHGTPASDAPAAPDAAQLEALRRQVAELEARLASQPATEGGKV